MSLPIFLLIYSVSFLSIGLWISLKALEKRLLPKEFLYIGALAASLTLYYAVFYLYLLSPSLAGTIVSLVIIFSLLALVKLSVECRKSAGLWSLVRKFFLVPLFITSVVMLAYSTIFFSCVSRPPALGGYNELDTRTFCHTRELPFDNSLDYIFGNNILNNQDKRQAIDWNMVDRPPLEIAATLPILDHGSHGSHFTQYYAYYVFAIFLQLGWVGAFWGAFQALKIDKKFQSLAFLALATTGFFYINSVFVWPKLLAASMVFTGIFILLGKNKPSKYHYLPFASLVIALGILSHSAVLFTLVPFGIYYLYQIIRLKKVNWKYFGAALAIGLLMLVPWYMYKSSVTKTDRLAKWYFAGVTSAADKRGTLETITGQYKTIGANKAVKVREHNTRVLFTGNYAPTPGCLFNAQGLFVNKCILLEWRTLTFFSTVFAFELLALGWFAVIYQFIRRKADLLDKELVLLISGGLLFWVLAIFLPGETVVHQGSYATMILAFMLILKKLSELPRVYIGAIATLQIILFYLAWITPYFRLG